MHFPIKSTRTPHKCRKNIPPHGPVGGWGAIRISIGTKQNFRRYKIKFPSVRNINFAGTEQNFHRHGLSCAKGSPQPFAPHARAGSGQGIMPAKPTASSFASLRGNGRNGFCVSRQMFYRLCGDVFPFLLRYSTAHSYGSYNPQLWVIQLTVMGCTTHNCGQ